MLETAAISKKPSNYCGRSKSKKSDADMYICMYMYAVISRVCATHTQPNTQHHTTPHNTAQHHTHTTHTHTQHRATPPFFATTTRNTMLNRIFYRGHDPSPLSTGPGSPDRYRWTIPECLIGHCHCHDPIIQVHRSRFLTDVGWLIPSLISLGPGFWQVLEFLLWRKKEKERKKKEERKRKKEEERRKREKKREERRKEERRKEKRRKEKRREEDEKEDEKEEEKEDREREERTKNKMKNKKIMIWTDAETGVHRRKLN